MHRLEQAATARGIASHGNIYDTHDDGFFVTPLSQDDQRATSARCYLGADVRARENLEIMCETRVLRIALDRRAGCRRRGGTGGGRETIAARQVVVSGGAVHSPALLLRSGIGPADDLRKLGIAVAADRPGVGRNYQNHPQMHFAMTLKPDSRMSAAAQHYIMTSRDSHPDLMAVRRATCSTTTPAASARAPSVPVWRWSRRAFTRRFRVGSSRYAPLTRMRRFASNSGFSPIRSMRSA